MQEASLTGFLKMIIIIFLAITVLKIIMRRLMPYIIKYVFGKRQQHDNKNTPKYNQKKSTQKKKIKYRQDNKVGEYIDYEELD